MNEKGVKENVKDRRVKENVKDNSVEQRDVTWE